ncbi:polymorphic toxin type 23 domain-containing protein [Chryseobacterium sp. CKR4-1]|uniref:polymorphic toxin type 23 domain-containing protein n=1 Tax=Chryseobacterium sp. CKR4-1 TaxID=3068896 RepID=UPI0027967021|nr:polymorphic toxin type 23 domain-containing protein [Chryseobacterium sp. CKR4-1]MDQ1805747.1 polymorphic toxin type 23 domain-containing protein [Chryseobacterium sp. CKR4-1]
MVTFSVSPSIAIGKGWGIGVNFSATFRAGDFAISGGFGIMNYGAHAGSGNSGWEFRKSAMFSYNSRDFGISLGTNKWSGLHPQQTGILGLRSGDFSMTYENYGSPFDKGPKWSHLRDNNDRWRTAAMTINIGEFSVGFNLFTGERMKDSYDDGWDNQMMDYVKNNGPLKGLGGATYPYGFAYENGPAYRLGAAYVDWGNYRIGINSDRYVKHPIQNIMAHGKLSPQSALLFLSTSINPYFQYKTRNKFTSW